MVTFPAGMSERQRAFIARQNALREKLRWTPPRSKRWRQLDAELRRLVREELHQEAQKADEPTSGPREPWWRRD